MVTDKILMNTQIFIKNRSHLYYLNRPCYLFPVDSKFSINKDADGNLHFANENFISPIIQMVTFEGGNITECSYRGVWNDIEGRL